VQNTHFHVQFCARDFVLPLPYKFNWTKLMQGINTVFTNFSCFQKICGINMFDNLLWTAPVRRIKSHNLKQEHDDKHGKQSYIMLHLFSVGEAEGANLCLTFLQRNINYLGLLFYNTP